VNRIEALDTRPRWPAVYRPVWKLLACCVAVGIAGVIVTLPAVVYLDSAASSAGPSSSLTPIWILLAIGLLLWALAVAGWAARKGSSRQASLVAGAVALVTVFATWAGVLLVLLVVLLVISGGG
jgi:hypothetical protein